MKLIIAGGRNLYISGSLIDGALHIHDIKPTQIVSGCAHGVDEAGKEWGWYMKLPTHLFPADWNTHGKAAGPIRNGQMAEYADALLLIWDGESRGSANMKSQMIKLNKPVYEVILKKA